MYQVQHSQKSEDEELSEDEDPDVKRMSEYFEKKYVSISRVYDIII